MKADGGVCVRYVGPDPRWSGVQGCIDRPHSDHALTHVRWDGCPIGPRTERVAAKYPPYVVALADLVATTDRVRQPLTVEEPLEWHDETTLFGDSDCACDACDRMRARIAENRAATWWRKFRDDM